MKIDITLQVVGLLNYAKAGQEAVKEIKRAMRRVLNVGRTAARRRIASEFQSRTGFLRRRSRAMQTKITVNAAEIGGRVMPLPRLLNIFESGATLAHGRGTLRARPVVGPAQSELDRSAQKEFQALLARVGK